MILYRCINLSGIKKITVIYFYIPVLDKPVRKSILWLDLIGVYDIDPCIASNFTYINPTIH